MTPQFWIGDSCTGSSLMNHNHPWMKEENVATKRHNYLAKIAKYDSQIWPFVHGRIDDIDRPWFLKHSWGLDPLVIPLLDILNEHGVHTISSCQGGVNFAPHILFTGPFEMAARAKSILMEKADWLNNPFNMPMVTIESDRPKQGGQGWSIYFHDTIALMAWNVAAGHGLASQLVAPEWFKGDVARPDDIKNLL